MSDEHVRIKDQTEDTQLVNGDFVIVDSLNEGTRKFNLGSELNNIKQDLQELIDGGGGSDGVPSNVRSAIYTLLSKALYTEAGLTDEKATVQAWATSVTAISVSPSTASISGVGTKQLTATTTPVGGVVSWESSNPSVATVNSSGLVTSVGNGNCTITARSGSVSATCSVTVSGISGDVTVTQEGSTLILGNVPTVTTITQNGSTLALA